MKILVVEDDALTASILEEYLLSAHYEVSVAVNGRDAMEKLQCDPVDIILLDRMMPEMDGMEFMREIHRFEKFRHIPVIMQTALDNVPEVIEGSQADIWYYLTKPYSEELLLSVIRSAEEYVTELRGKS